MSDDVVKMSSKGQLVVPKEIREQAGFDPSDRFIAVPVDDGVLFKKIDFDVREEYEKLSERVQERFEAEGVSEDEVEDAIEWARE
jgi:bifunctional DNA-binding transcriptional regulator/antitoxin component of YhaV-PrlF toxin-antitoxin module